MANNNMNEIIEIENQLTNPPSTTTTIENNESTTVSPTTESTTNLIPVELKKKFLAELLKIKNKNIDDDEFKALYEACRALTWGDYNRKKGIKLGIIKENIKLPKDYKREFFVYFEEKDIHGNNIKKEPLYEGTQKRFIYWVPSRQK